MVKFVEGSCTCKGERGEEMARAFKCKQGKGGEAESTSVSSRSSCSGCPPVSIPTPESRQATVQRFCVPLPHLRCNLGSTTSQTCTFRVLDCVHDVDGTASGEVQQSTGSIRVSECVSIHILCTQSSARSKNCNDNVSVSVAADGSYGDIGISVTRRWQHHYCLHANHCNKLDDSPWFETVRRGCILSYVSQVLFNHVVGHVDFPFCYVHRGSSVATTEASNGSCRYEHSDGDGRRVPQVV